MKLPLKILILATIALSLVSGFLPELYGWLALSWIGIKKLFLWQLVSYCLVERGPLSFGFFLNLAFNMYILWLFGSHLIERSHSRLFLMLYFGAVLFGGASTLFLPHTFLAGSANGVYAVMVAWTLLNPGSQLLLFFTLPFKALWLILGLLGFTLFIDLSSGYWAGALSLATASLYSYFFTLIAWRHPGPFPFLRKFEKRLFQLLERKKGHTGYTRSKIYDIRSGEPILDDEQFMDAMLDRIARHGENSLSPEEKKRMKEISNRKK